MITRIELDGFKTFLDFKMDLSPFQVIVGANGVGKSNLFDALRLLSKLADTDLRSAFQDLRGEASELFTILPDGQAADRMRLAVEMLVERVIVDSWGAQEELKHTRLRYELEIERRADELGLERLYVRHESLDAINRDADSWFKKHATSDIELWRPKLKAGRKVSFISTRTEGANRTILLHQDGHGSQRQSVAEKVERTILSGITNTDFPHVLAAREEMRSWKFLQLNPEVLRQPSDMVAHQFVSGDGSNLPSTLARLQAEDPDLLIDISRDLANLVPGILEVEVAKDQARSRYVIKAHTEDGRIFSSRVLSDGTLRLLTLVTLKNDTQHRGVLCFEEPENGVHPFRLKNVVRLLRDLVTDFSEPEQAGLPLRQLLVATHSPVLVSEIVAQDVPGGRPELTFAYIATRVEPGANKRPLRVTRMASVDKSKQSKIEFGTPEDAYTWTQVISYLETADVGETLASLHKGNGR